MLNRMGISDIWNSYSFRTPCRVCAPLVSQGLLQADLSQDCSGHHSISVAEKGANCEEKRIIETWYVRCSILVGCGMLTGMATQ